MAIVLKRHETLKVHPINFSMIVKFISHYQQLFIKCYKFCQETFSLIRFKTFIVLSQKVRCIFKDHV